jgi:hypothetical protein
MSTPEEDLLFAIFGERPLAVAEDECGECGHERSEHDTEGAQMGRVKCWFVDQFEYSRGCGCSGWTSQAAGPSDA